MRCWPVVLVVLAGCGGRPLAVLEDGAPVGTRRDGASPAFCESTWSCGGGGCTTDGGLPLVGEQWVCHSVRLPNPPVWDGERVVWECNGRVLAGAGTPDGCGWRCGLEASDVFDGELAERQYRCVREHQDGVDSPPGGTVWPVCKMEMSSVCFSCRKGSELGGTQCKQLP